MWRLWARLGLERVEKGAITGVGLFFGLKLAFNLFFTDLTTNWAEIESSYWALACVMVLVYIVFTPRQGLMVGLDIVALTLALGLFRLGESFQGADTKRNFWPLSVARFACWRWQVCSIC